MEVIGLVKPLPIDKPEQLLFDERSAGPKPNLVSVKWRVAGVFAACIKAPSLSLRSSKVLVTAEIENAAVNLVSPTPGDHADRA